ncbi:MAG: TonB family protein [Deltaproteobacteria bacterium]|nr:TonB family protein [Deltaproteobacteria bacterium]
MRVLGWSLACLSLFLSSDLVSHARAEDLLERALMSVPAERDATRCMTPYFFVGTESRTDLLPLVGHRAEVDIAGVIAAVKIIQTYRNKGDRVIEAVYLFPASTRAAVHGLRMRIGERTIEARIQESEAARGQYESARDTGRTASLLEQHRPNVFQMSVANILPGDEIQVELDYTELLVPRDNRYELSLPAVVGPRYSNGSATSEKQRGRWVENPYLHEGEKPRFEFELDLELRAGMPIARVSCASHEVDVVYAGEDTACVRIEDPRAGTRDFVLRYELAGDEIQQGCLLAPGQPEPFFLLMLQPPAEPVEAQILPREYLFVLDVSGSMDGFPLQTAKTIIKHMFRDLRSYDSFNVLLFAGASEVFSAQPLAASARNVRRAAAWIDLHHGGGGTELLPALKRAMDMERSDEKKSRAVVLLTDGYVHVEKEAFELVRDRISDASLFPFGIGSSVNRFLIEGLARAGMGEPFIVLDPEQAESQAERFRRIIDAPLLRSVEVEFDGLDVHDVEPPAIPDLFAGRPVVVFGKLRDRARGQVCVRGMGSDGEHRCCIEVEEADSSQENEAIRYLWARHRVASLIDLERLERNDARRDEVIRIGLAHSLLTEYTSFVAIDSRVRADGKRIETVRQPLPMPAGVPDGAVGVGLGVTGSSGSRARVGAACVMGSLSTDSIRRVIRMRSAEIKSLYERQLKSNPMLAGKVVLRLVIGPDGRVVKAEVQSSTLGEEEFEQALLNIASRWRFPALPGGGQVVVSYPFIFRSVE